MRQVPDTRRCRRQDAEVENTARWLRTTVVADLCVFLIVAMAPARTAYAQELPEKSWAPGPGVVGISYGVYGTDSETTKRLGLWWVRSSRNVLGVTGQFWNGYRHLELGSRWYARRTSRVAPFLMISGTWQRLGYSEGVGPGVAMGADYHVGRQVGFTMGVGWRSLFRWSRMPGYSDPRDIQWFTIRGEVTYYLGHRGRHVSG